MPTVAHKRSLCAASAALLALLAAAPANAGPRPKLKAAYTVDRDRNGHVDAIKLRWSKKVRGGRDRKEPFSFKVKGYRVSAVSRTRGKKQRLLVEERPECDTGGSVLLRYRPARKGKARILTKRGKKKARKQRLDMRRFDPPIPRITCAVTLDRDDNARVDGVRLTYSRSVRSRAQTKGRFLFSVAGYRITSVGRARGRFLEIQLSENGRPDSGATPAIGYKRPKGKRKRPYAVRAKRRKKAFTATYQETRDGVSPQLLAAATGDADRDGLLDSMAVQFSEPVQTNGTGIAVVGMPVRSIGSLNRSTLALGLNEVGARGDVRPGVWVAGPGVTDVSGNAALPGAVTPADRAAPVMTSAVTQDTGAAPGQIDAVSVGFSEPVAHARDAGGAYPFLVTNRRVTSVEPASGTDVQVRIAEAATPDSGERPGVRFIPGIGLPVLDAAGNQAGEGLVNAADGAAPVLVSAVTADADGDGRIDGTTLRFSEPVRHGAEGGGSFTLPGHSVTAAGEASGAEVALTLAEGASGNSGSTPTVTYSRDGIEDVADAAGNLTPNSSVGANDGAPPVLLSARTADVVPAGGDGRIDRVETTWSEPLTHADDTSAPFALSASGFAVKRVRAASGTGLAIDLVEPNGYDTGSTPTVSYDGTSPLRDAAGLEPAKKTWAGLTVDALPPRLVSATTGDADGDGSLDEITTGFSEAVVHARETTQSSFSAGALTILSAEEADGDKVQLKLQETGAGNSGLRPAVSYTPDGQQDVRDAAGNLAPTTSLAQAADGAAPVLLSAATVDDNSDARLDRVTTQWSEPLVHANDTSAPFPVSLEQFAVTRVHAAAGATLDIDLAEPGAPDTGSAPDLTYDGGTDPIRDASGLEPAKKKYAGLTRDALAPVWVSTYTVDNDFDGRLDGVEIEWSEEVTGATDSTPFTVSDSSFARTLAGVDFSGAKTRVRFDENPAAHDTHEKPDVAYDAGLGDLHDIAEGVSDTADNAPTVALETATDKAAPILVAAKTVDASTPDAGDTPNGTIDAVLTTFSEPISHAIDGFAPFSLNVAGRSEKEVDGDTGGRTLYVTVKENAVPDGGETPNVTVQSVGPVADRIKDRAPEPNEARPMTFTGTTDDVRPVLMSAELGEEVGAACTQEPVAGIDGEVDCVRAKWSEDVRIDADATAPYSIVPSDWTIAPGGIPARGPARTLDIPLAQSGSVDRDQSGTTIAYDQLNDLPVEDLASKESLDGSTFADAACRDAGAEGNDVQQSSNPQLDTTSPSFQRKCAFDADWYRVSTAATGFLEVVTRPAAGLDLEFELYDSAENEVAADNPALEIGGAGEVDRRTFSGLAPTTDYYLLVKAGTPDETTAPQEGPYCVVFANVSGADPGCGPLAGQIVFTEAGFGSDKFVEIKNDVDVPVDMDGASAELIFGPADDPRTRCDLILPTNSINSIIEPDEHVLVEQTASATSFGCNEISSLGPAGERLELNASGSIDVVDFTGIVDSAAASQHSLQFVEGDLPDGDENNDVQKRWCRTSASHSKGAEGDGCDEYRINEVLWQPTSMASTSDGKAFVELAGNIPALPDSELLGGWVLRGVHGRTGGGSEDFTLPAGASPRDNGTYVIADGLDDGSGSLVAGTDLDATWDNLNLNSPLWPDETDTAGPRGLQLLTPSPPSAPPCTNSADAFGWNTSGLPLSKPLDNLRSCPSVEGTEYTNGAVGSSAARDSESADTNHNRNDFCPQATPNPGAVNTRPDC